MAKHSRSHVLSLAISLGEWRSRLAFILFILLASFLIMLNKAENPAAIAMRMALTDALAPAVGFVSQPMHGVQSFGDQWQQWQDVYAQNMQLRAENTKLKQWYRVSAELNTENKSLRKLLKLAPTHAGHFVSGKMLGSVAGAFSQSQFVSVGKADDVAANMTVISGEGLVGRLQEVAEDNSRVMLVTDMNSHIAVVTQGNRENAMAVGRNGALLELRYLPKHSNLKLGEMVVTSGDAGLMPAGIPVGQVVKITPQEVLVKPIVDWSRLDYVSIVAPE